MGGEAGKALCQPEKVQAVLTFEPCLAERMLLCVVFPAKAYRPAIGWLQPSPTVAASVYVRALNRRTLAAIHHAVMPTDPSSVTWARTRHPRPSLSGDPLRKQARHALPSWSRQHRCRA